MKIRHPSLIYASRSGIRGRQQGLAFVATSLADLALSRNKPVCQNRDQYSVALLNLPDHSGGAPPTLMERRAETEGRQRDDAEMCGIRQDRGSRGEEKGRWDDARGTALSSLFSVFPPSMTGRNCRYFRNFPNGRVDKLWWRPAKFPGRERKSHK